MVHRPTLFSLSLSHTHTHFILYDSYYIIKYVFVYIKKVGYLCLSYKKYEPSSSKNIDSSTEYTHGIMNVLTFSNYYHYYYYDCYYYFYLNCHYVFQCLAMLYLLK